MKANLAADSSGMLNRRDFVGVMLGGGSGRLPNEATRKRMAESIGSLPLAEKNHSSIPLGRIV